MNKQHNNQAEQLQDLVNALQDNEPDNNNKSTKPFSGAEHVRKIDVLNLPPRKVIHEKKGWTKIKFRKPFVRLLFVSVLLIILILGTYYYWGNDLLDVLKQL